MADDSPATTTPAASPTLSASTADRPTIPITATTPGALSAAQESLGYIAADWTRRGPYGHWLPPGGVMDYDPRQLFRLDPRFLAQYEGKVPGWLPIGRMVWERTYAKYLHHLGRPETPSEVFARCCEAVFGVYEDHAERHERHWSASKAQREAQEMFRRMWGCGDDPDDVGASWAHALDGAEPAPRTSRFLPAGRQLANLGTVAMLAKGGMCLNSCAFVSTADIGNHAERGAFTRPFAFLMDALMLGVGVGFDTRGAGKVRLVSPALGDTFAVVDTREGWVAAASTLLGAFVGEGALPSAWDVSAIRAKGLPLKTFGGTSSGPAPLLALLSSLESLSRSYVGRVADSAFITDVANLIGRCVVAGGVRRSSEIGLGEWGDADFLALKDPSALAAEYQTQARVRGILPVAVELDAEIAAHRTEQAKHRPIDPVWATWQDSIDTLEGRVYAALSTDPEWAGAEARINAHPLRTHRWSSNNSLFAEVGADYADIGARNAANGEPGLVWLDNVRRFGRMVDGDLALRRDARGEGMQGLRPDTAQGCNPCQPAHATVLTPEGIRTFADIDVGSTVWSGQRWTKVVKKVATGVKPVLRYVTAAGVFVGTANHRVVQRGEKTEVQYATHIDMCPIPGVGDGFATALAVGIDAVQELGEMPVYDITVDAPEHTYWTGGLLVSNCGEQGLEDREVCNLVCTFPTNHKTTADWYATLKSAYLVGKAVSCIPVHDTATDAIVRRNRRIGIDVGGVAEWHERIGMRSMCAALDVGYRELRRIDALYSGWLAMPESIRLTTVKPGGSVPLVVGVEGGMRFPEAPYYIRTVRLHDTSPLIDRLAAAGHRIEPDRYAPHTVVAYFPMRDTRVGRYARDVSLWEQAGLQAALQRWWSDNLVSATWMVQAHEAKDIPAVLTAHDAHLKGFSALPLRNHNYAQAPYTECTEAEYHALACKLRPVDFASLTFSRVDRENAAEKFCTGDRCEIPVG